MSYTDNFSLRLDTQDASRWDRNQPNFTVDLLISVSFSVSVCLYIYIYIYICTLLRLSKKFCLDVHFFPKWTFYSAGPGKYTRLGLRKNTGVLQ